MFQTVIEKELGTKHVPMATKSILFPVRLFSYCFIKGPVKLIKRVKIALSCLVCVRSVSRYDFKLAYVILEMAVEEFFQTHF